jgi:protein-S-isoprenylcysteine O-methyltransferase Ste14
MLAALAFGFLVLARAAYVLGIGLMLTRQERHETYTRRLGLEGGFAHFRRVSTVLMVFDTAAFILLCIVTAETLRTSVPRWLLVAGGLAIGIFGLAIKTWATRVLGPRAYHWYNFFDPAEPVQWEPRGPYRFLRNPMYGAGYLQTYGLAFVCASLHGLVAAVFMQVTILMFNQLVEKPHFQRLAGAGRQGAAPGK